MNANPLRLENLFMSISFWESELSKRTMSSRLPQLSWCSLIAGWDLGQSEDMNALHANFVSAGCVTRRLQVEDVTAKRRVIPEI
jgi:hypothetical protein